MQSSVKVNRNSHTCVTELTLGLVVVCNTVYSGIDPIPSKYRRYRYFLINKVDASLNC